ncbi:MAG: sigma-70 family RNA polymerase sigma factor [Ferruginibacter sp.]
MHQKEKEKEFELLIKQHELLIFKVCAMYASEAGDRQDLFQEIVIQLWKAFKNFRGESKFSTWLYRVAINTAITRSRKEKKFIDLYDPASMPVQISDVNNSIEQEEQLQQLYLSIGQLNEIEKAITMLYLEDRSYEEMSNILGISEGTLRVKMNRIKEKLRQMTKNN